MKYSNFFWGAILIILGCLFILKNVGLVYFNWGSILRLWPLLLVLWGISVLPIRNFFKFILTIVTIVLALVLVFNTPYYWHWNGFQHGPKWEYRHDDDRYFKDRWENQEINEPYNENIKYADLKFDAAIGDFVINEESSELMEFEKEGNLGPYSFSTKSSYDRKTLILDLKRNKFIGSNLENKASIKLNPNPVWDMDIDVGAADINLDLTPFKIQNLEIDGGASSINIKIGDKYDNVKLGIDAGASSIRIKVPEEAGCKIDASTFLTSRNLEEFEKIKKGLYQTENFETSTNKVYISINAGITSFIIKRY